MMEIKNLETHPPLIKYVIIKYNSGLLVGSHQRLGIFYYKFFYHLITRKIKIICKKLIFDCPPNRIQEIEIYL